tara:strand:+ start:281 stop:571 length:291 start_codon:yes stop_codon:yes gene_type:complete
VDRARAAAQIAKTIFCSSCQRAQAQGQAQGGVEEMEWTLMIICGPRAAAAAAVAEQGRAQGPEQGQGQGKSAVEVTMRFFQVAALTRRHQGWRIAH